MSEVWSIALTRESLCVCAVGQDMKRRTYLERIPVGRMYGMRCTGPEVLFRLLGGLLSRLLLESDELPLCVCLSVPDGETAIFCGRNGEYLTPVFWDMPLTISRRDIPERYQQDEYLCGVYRSSVKRRLCQAEPGLGLLDGVGLWSVGAMLSYALTGRGADACVAMGVVEGYPGFEAETSEVIEEAMGIELDLSSRRCRTGFVVGRLSEEMAGRLHCEEMSVLKRLSGVPLYAMGSSEGGCAYGCGATPLSWCVQCGWGLKAVWPAGRSALSPYEVSILEPGNAPEDDEKRAREEGVSADEWTQIMDSRGPVSVSEGPGKGRLTYGYRLEPFESPVMVQGVLSVMDEEGRIQPDVLKRVPVGSNGLHVCFRETGWELIGLKPAHEASHLARGLFEGEMYELRSRLERACPEGMGPIRLMKSELWPEEFVPLAADILGREVIYVDETAAGMAAFGAALLLMREEGIEIVEKPRLTAHVIENGARTGYYQAHYRVHCQL